MWVLTAVVVAVVRGGTRLLPLQKDGKDLIAVNGGCLNGGGREGSKDKLDGVHLDFDFANVKRMYSLKYKCV